MPMQPPGHRRSTLPFSLFHPILSPPATGGSRTAAVDHRRHPAAHHGPPPPPPTSSSTRPPSPRLALATRTHAQPPFVVSTRKLPILKAGPIEALQARLNLPAIPEMIFGDNLVRVAHPRTGWSVAFSAEGALDTVDKTGAGEVLQVAYAREWSRSREGQQVGVEVVRMYDWSYSAVYKGDEVPASVSSSSAAAAAAAAGGDGEGKGNGNGEEEPSEPGEHGRTARRRLAVDETGRTEIPIELLKRRDPILFADEVVLYESELDDNGTSAMTVKLRVMEERMLLLCRLFMRLDGVLVRVRDTRLYVEFATEDVIREYTAREDTFENVKRKLLMSGLTPDGVTVALRDSNEVAPLLPIVERTVERLCLADKA
ncbi:hypothetical protein VTJ83DRAFT_2658 [Remersonia thermophila]|uniref:Uncharacterized protein n=1 Tax=Remersonia thermophila TaxID=72144 RepID=A0ABR4DJG6_9PEZI